MMQFLQMGGYAVYVWPAFGLALAVLGMNIVWARHALAGAQLEARRRLTEARYASGDAAAAAGPAQELP